MADLAVFCSDCVAWMKEPFVRDGKRIATDGRIAVLLVDVDEPDTPQRGRRPFPELSKPFGEYEWTTAFGDIVAPEVDTTESCYDCNGVGRKRYECDMCNGTGEHKCDCGFVVPRDYNSALEIKRLCLQKIRQELPEYKYLEMEALPIGQLLSMKNEVPCDS